MSDDSPARQDPGWDIQTLVGEPLNCLRGLLLCLPPVCTQTLRICILTGIVWYCVCVCAHVYTRALSSWKTVPSEISEVKSASSLTFLWPLSGAGT